MKQWFSDIAQKQHRTVVLEREEANERTPTTANFLPTTVSKPQCREEVASTEPGSVSNLKSQVWRGQGHPY